MILTDLYNFMPTAQHKDVYNSEEIYDMKITYTVIGQASATEYVEDEW